MSNSINMIGVTVGIITVVARTESNSAGNSLWECTCRCGNITIVSGLKLREGLKKKSRMSCGGCKPEIKFRKEYNAWCGMNDRCYTETVHNYHNYGGRGITVQLSWRLEFFNFLDDVGLCPQEDYTLDRIDVNGNYELSNVRWANRYIQRINQRPKSDWLSPEGVK